MLYEPLKPDGFPEEFLKEYFSRISSCLPAALAMYSTFAQRVMWEGGAQQTAFGRQEIDRHLRTSPLSSGSWSVDGIITTRNDSETILVSAIIMDHCGSRYLEKFLVCPPTLPPNTYTSSFSYWDSVIISETLSSSRDVSGDSISIEFALPPLHPLVAEEASTSSGKSSFISCSPVPIVGLSRASLSVGCFDRFLDNTSFGPREDSVSPRTLPPGFVTPRAHTAGTKNSITSTQHSAFTASQMSDLTGRRCLGPLTSSIGCYAKSFAYEANDGVDGVTVKSKISSNTEPNASTTVLGPWSAPTSPQLLSFQDSDIGTLLEAIDGNESIDECAASTRGANASQPDDVFEPTPAVEDDDGSMFRTLCSLLLESGQRSNKSIIEAESLSSLWADIMTDDHSPPIRQTRHFAGMTEMISSPATPLLPPVIKSRTAPSSPVATDRHSSRGLYDDAVTLIPPLKLDVHDISDACPGIDVDGYPRISDALRKAFCESDVPPPYSGTLRGGTVRLDRDSNNFHGSNPSPSASKSIDFRSYRRTSVDSNKEPQPMPLTARSVHPQPSTTPGGKPTPPTFWGMWADERDRMIYVSWLPRVARACDRLDKKKCELQLKEFIAGKLGFKELEKVLLFPPSSAHCKLIFKSEQTAYSFLTTYGGLEGSVGPELWKHVICNEFGVNIKDGIESTRVKVIWADQTKNEADRMICDSVKNCPLINDSHFRPSSRNSPSRKGRGQRRSGWDTNTPRYGGDKSRCGEDGNCSGINDPLSPPAQDEVDFVMPQSYYYNAYGWRQGGTSASILADHQQLGLRSNFDAAVTSNGFGGRGSSVLAPRRTVTSLH